MIINALAHLPYPVRWIIVNGIVGLFAVLDMAIALASRHWRFFVAAGVFAWAVRRAT